MGPFGRGGMGGGVVGIGPEAGVGVSDLGGVVIFGGSGTTPSGGVTFFTSGSTAAAVGFAASAPIRKHF